MDDYLEQVNTRGSENHYSLNDVFGKTFFGKSFLPEYERPKNILTAMYKMPIKDWWKKYAFTDDKDHSAPTNDNYLTLGVK